MKEGKRCDTTVARDALTCALDAIALARHAIFSPLVLGGGGGGRLRDEPKGRL